MTVIGRPIFIVFSIAHVLILGIVCMAGSGLAYRIHLKFHRSRNYKKVVFEASDPSKLHKSEVQNNSLRFKNQVWCLSCIKRRATILLNPQTSRFLEIVNINLLKK